MTFKATRPLPGNAARLSAAIRLALRYTARELIFARAPRGDERRPIESSVSRTALVVAAGVSIPSVQSRQESKRVPCLDDFVPLINSESGVP